MVSWLPFQYLIHGTYFLPRHRHLPPAYTLSVTYVPGLFVTSLPGLYQKGGHPWAGDT